MIPFLSTAKLIAGGVVLAAVLAAVWVVNGWRTDAAQVPLLEQRLADQRATLIEERRQKREADAASEVYQDELATLRAARAAAPAGPVRLCRQPAAAGVPLPAAQPGPASAAPAAGLVPAGTGADTGAGPDIGPRLRALADRADDLSAQLRGALDHDRRQAGGP